MNKADRLRQQKKEYYNRNKDKINAKRRDQYHEHNQTNNAAVGEVFTTQKTKSLALVNPASVNTTKVQWQEGMRVPDYLEAVVNKSKTFTPNSGLYSNKYEVSQQRDQSNFNMKYLRTAPTEKIYKPTPHSIIAPQDVPAWKQQGREQEHKDYKAQYACGFF